MSVLLTWPVRRSAAERVSGRLRHVVPRRGKKGQTGGGTARVVMVVVPLCRGRVKAPAGRESHATIDRPRVGRWARVEASYR